MNEETKIEFISLLILLGFLTAVIFHYVVAVYFGAPFPLNTFLFLPPSKFSDFFSVYLAAHKLAPYTAQLPPEGSVYFPWAYLAMYPFICWGKYVSLIIYCIFCLTAIIGFCSYYFQRKEYPNTDLYYSNVALNIKNIIIFSLMTYHVIFSFERGNVEFLIFIFLGFFVLFYNKQNYIKSSIFLASAIAMKLF